MSLRQGAAAANIELHGRGGYKTIAGCRGTRSHPTTRGTDTCNKPGKARGEQAPMGGGPLSPPPSIPVPAAGHRRRDTRATGRYGPADKSCFTSFMSPCGAAPPWQSQTRTCLRAGIAVA